MRCPRLDAASRQSLACERARSHPQQAPEILPARLAAVADGEVVQLAARPAHISLHCQPPQPREQAQREEAERRARRGREHACETDETSETY